MKKRYVPTSRASTPEPSPVSKFGPNGAQPVLQYPIPTQQEKRNPHQSPAQTPFPLLTCIRHNPTSTGTATILASKIPVASANPMEPIWKARDWRVRSASMSVSASVSEFGSRACKEEMDSQGSGGGSCVTLWNTFTLSISRLSSAQLSQRKKKENETKKNKHSLCQPPTNPLQTHQRKNTPHIPHALFPYPAPLTITVYHPFHFPNNFFPHLITTTTPTAAPIITPPSKHTHSGLQRQHCQNRRLHKRRDFDPSSRERRKPDRDR
jgi:hypothetical protein